MPPIWASARTAGTVLATVCLIYILLRISTTRPEESDIYYDSTRELSSLERPDSLSPRIVRAGYLHMPGFLCVAEVDSIAIEPNLDLKSEFRTSQLVALNGKVWPSRKVFYKSVHKHAPSVVIVLPLNANERMDVLKEALNERKRYCKTHNYGLFVRYIQDFAAEGRPAKEAFGLAPIRMLRQAMEAFPKSSWFWLYDSNGRINNLDSELLALDKTKLNDAMKTDLDETIDAVPIANFATHAEDADIIVSYDPGKKLLSTKSLYVNRSIASLAFLESLVDPILQNWEPFYKSDNHAGLVLTHISRWHTRLVKSMTLLPPQISGTQLCSEAKRGEEPCIVNNRHSDTHQ